jgi:uncharacterized protein (DUF2267 family)
MVDTGYSTFSTTVDKTNQILHEIEMAHGWPRERRSQSYAAMRAVLHTLRDRLNVEETAQLGAQLPILVRGIYYGEWDPSRVPEKMNAAQFLQRVRAEFPYDVMGGIEQVIRSVLRALRRHISDGEWDDALSGMPPDLRTLLANWTAGQQAGP